MDTTKRLTIDEVQFYLAKGALLLPSLYEQFLVDFETMSHADRASLLPKAIFDLYHIRLRKKLTLRIEQAQKRMRRVA